VTGATITDLDVTYVRDRAAAVKADLTALAAVDSVHADNKAIQIDATNAPGLYRVDWPDAAFAAGVSRVQLVVNGAAVDPAVLEVELAPWLTLITGAMVLADATAISGDTTAADRLEATLDAMPSGAVVDDDDPDPTTTLFETNLAEATNDHYNGAFVVFTSGVLLGQSRKISDYDGTTKVLTVAAAFTDAPAAADTFIILGRSE
jgi:hypothetical protein